MYLAASATVTGLPALLIILVILALIVTGAVVLVRGVARKGKQEIDKHSHSTSS